MKDKSHEDNVLTAFQQTVGDLHLCEITQTQPCTPALFPFQVFLSTVTYSSVFRKNFPRTKKLQDGVGWRTPVRTPPSNFF